MNTDETVMGSLKAYCQKHGLDLATIPSILNEPKVVPMIRGIGYEYVVESELRKLFAHDGRFQVHKSKVNAQLTVKGSDVEVLDVKLNKTIRIECKLAANGSFESGTRKHKFPHCLIKVMRSRTVGEEVAKKVAKRGEATKRQIMAHSDSYLPSAFDYVVTNLRNAFYVTTEEGEFKFQPTDEQWQFLMKFFNKKSREEIDEDLKRNNYFIRTDKLIPKNNELKCARRKCPNPDTCIFIPNFPIFKLDHPMIWKPLNELKQELVIQN